MQVDPIHWRVPPARSRRRTWRSGGARFALLPLALGLLPAGLLSACTLGAPRLTATESVPALPSVPGPMVGPVARGSLSGPAPAAAAGMAPRFPATLAHAEQGDVDAMVRLAHMHETGTAEVAQDRTEMLRWLALASAMGSGLASWRLFVHYEDQPNGQGRALRFKDLAQRQGYFGPVSAHSSR